jgi:hypothetical protein
MRGRDSFPSEDFTTKTQRAQRRKAGSSKQKKQNAWPLDLSDYAFRLPE